MAGHTSINALQSTWCRRVIFDVCTPDFFLLLFCPLHSFHFSLLLHFFLGGGGGEVANLTTLPIFGTMYFAILFLP